MIGVIHAKQTGKKVHRTLKVAEEPSNKCVFSGRKFWKLMVVVR